MVRLWTLRSVVALLVGLSLPATPAVAQGRGGGAPNAGQRHEMFMLRLGRFEVRPFVQVGEITYDTNVFYDGENRTSDVYTAGGPGLDITLPVSNFTFSLTGLGRYTHYFKTTELRRLGGNVAGKAEWERGILHLGFERLYDANYERPNFEVNQRVWRDNWRNHFIIDIGAETRGRLGVQVGADADRIEYEPGQTYLGSEVSTNLNRDTYRGSLQLRYRVTAKTSLVAEGDYQADRFLVDERRDLDSNRIGAGVELQSQTRLFGSIVGGVRLFRPRTPGAERFQDPWVRAQVGYSFGPRTSITAAFTFDSDFSAFDVEGGFPSQQRKTASVTIRRQFTPKVDLQLDGRVQFYRTDNEVVSNDPDVPSQVRDDRGYEAFADLGYTIFRRLRLGLRATYTERNATFADFGVDGLLFGMTLSFNPF